MSWGCNRHGSDDRRCRMSRVSPNPCQSARSRGPSSPQTRRTGAPGNSRFPEEEGGIIAGMRRFCFVAEILAAASWRAESFSRRVSPPALPNGDQLPSALPIWLHKTVDANAYVAPASPFVPGIEPAVPQCPAHDVTASRIGQQQIEVRPGHVPKLHADVSCNQFQWNHLEGRWSLASRRCAARGERGDQLWSHSSHGAYFWGRRRQSHMDHPRRGRSLVDGCLWRRSR